MFQKFIFSLLLVSTVATAETTVVNIGAATSPTALYAQAFAKNLPNSKFITVKNCAEATEVARNNSNAVFVLVNDIFVQSQRLNQECNLPITTTSIVAMSDAYFEICRKSGNAKSLLVPNIIVGRASVHPIKEWQADFNKRNQASVKAVGYSGSKAVLAAVLNGEVDWGYIATEIAEPAIAQGTIECPYNSNASSPRSLHRSYDMQMNEYVLKYALVTTSKDASIVKELRAAARNEQFLNYLTVSRHANLVITPTDYNIDSFYQSVKSLNLLLDTYK